MICNFIVLENYRNIVSAKAEFSPGVNFLYGKNAEGKTNMLEAIYLFARGKSFRTSHDTELIRHGEEIAHAKISFTDSKRVQNFEIFYNSDGKRKCIKNGVSLGRMSELIGDFRAVLFCPQMLGIVQEGPAVRRNFLDVAISQIKPVYLSSLQKYKGLLMQRNALLKDHLNYPEYKEMLDVFAMQMAPLAEILSTERKKYAEYLSEYVSVYFRDMTSGREVIGINYEEEHTEEEFYRIFTENINKELKYGVSLYGPQKDDMELMLNSYPARDFCSQGQQRSIALALKIAEGEISKKICGEYPVFLFDDILSELDDIRREYLLQNLEERQIILTSCENQFADVRKFLVKNGTYTVINN